MKRIFLSLLVLVATLSASAQTNWHITVTLPDMPDTVDLYNFDYDNMRFVNKQQLVTKDHSVSYAAQLDSITSFSLRYPGTTRSLSINGVPGESLSVTGTVEKPAYHGSAFYQRWEAVTKAVMTPYLDQIEALSQQADSMRKAGISRDSANNFYRQHATVLYADMQKASMDYIKAHPADEMSAYLLTGLEYPEIKEALSILTPEVRDGRMKAIYGPVLRLQQRLEQTKENQKNIKEGIAAPDFTLNDIHGKPLSLKSLRGKYVILDFWGSWCGWCIKGMPQMKEYYKKYAGKFEILGVDCNDTPEKWKAAVEKHELPWLHVYNTAAVGVNTLYGIQGYPTKIVIGPEGKIVKIVEGEDPAFYAYLDQLFGKK